MINSVLSGSGNHRAQGLDDPVSALDGAIRKVEATLQDASDFLSIHRRSNSPFRALTASLHLRLPTTPHGGRFPAAKLFRLET